MRESTGRKTLIVSAHHNQTKEAVDDYIEQTKAGPVIRIRVTPRSAKPGVRPGPGRLSVGVRSPAERGKATEEALRTVAELIDLPRSALELAGGATSRDKRVLVPGETLSDLRKRILRGLGTLL